MHVLHTRIRPPIPHTLQAGKVEVAAEKLVVAAGRGVSGDSGGCPFFFHLNNCKTINGPGSEMECFSITCSLLHGKHLQQRGVKKK